MCTISHHSYSNISTKLHSIHAPYRLPKDHCFSSHTSVSRDVTRTARPTSPIHSRRTPVIPQDLLAFRTHKEASVSGTVWNSKAQLARCCLVR